MINTLGGRGGGHGLYLLKGKPVFVYNFFDLERFRWEGPAALTPGKHTVVFDFKYDGPGFGKGGTGVLSVDGKEVASAEIMVAPDMPDLLAHAEEGKARLDAWRAANLREMRHAWLHENALPGAVAT